MTLVGGLSPTRSVRLCSGISLPTCRAVYGMIIEV
jgi:hypothetical protein